MFIEKYPESMFVQKAYYALAQNYFREKEYTKAEKTFNDIKKNFKDSEYKTASNYYLGVIYKQKAEEDIQKDNEKEAFSKTDAYVEEFEKAMDDDFNTADAISAIFELVKLANSNSSSDNSKEYIDTLMKKITTLTDILGLKTDKKEEMLDEDIEALIAERQQARKDKNFARADEIRDELLAKGIVLKDTREGVRWSRA